MDQNGDIPEPGANFRAFASDGASFAAPEGEETFFGKYGIYLAAIALAAAGIAFHQASPMPTSDLSCERAPREAGKIVLIPSGDGFIHVPMAGEDKAAPCVPTASMR